MLEQLFGSQTRVKLLHLFLNNTEEKYFVRELTRVLDSQINAIRRELDNLHKFGIVKIVDADDENKSDKTKRKFFQADPKFVLYPELKSIFQKASFLVEKKFANTLKKAGKIHYLALTGYFVGDKNLAIDILIVGDLNKKKVENTLKKFEKDFRRELNYTVLGKDEFEYRRSVADRFLYMVLDAEKIVMIDEIFNKNPVIETESEE